MQFLNLWESGKDIRLQGTFLTGKKSSYLLDSFPFCFLSWGLSFASKFPPLGLIFSLWLMGVGVSVIFLLGKIED